MSTNFVIKIDICNILCPATQLNFSVLMEIDASPEGRCATGTTTVKTDQMNWIVGAYLRAATTAVITNSAVYQKPFCAMVRETVPMAPMKRSVVGDDRLLYINLTLTTLSTGVFHSRFDPLREPPVSLRQWPVCV